VPKTGWYYVFNNSVLKLGFTHFYHNSCECSLNWAYGDVNSSDCVTSLIISMAMVSQFLNKGLKFGHKK